MSLGSKTARNEVPETTSVRRVAKGEIKHQEWPHTQPIDSSLINSFSTTLKEIQSHYYPVDVSTGPAELPGQSAPQKSASFQK